MKFPEPEVSTPTEPTTEFEKFGKELTAATELAEREGEEERVEQLIEDRRQYTIIMDYLRADHQEDYSRTAYHLEEYAGEAADLLEQHTDDD